MPEPSPPRPRSALAEARRRRLGVWAATQDVEHALATASVGRAGPWMSELRTRAGRLADAWAQHITATEAPDGLFSEVLEDAPRLNHRIDLLRADHLAVGDGIADLMTRAETASDDDLDELRERALELLGRISRHRHLGADLVYEAYTVDIEAAD